jgi:hypothetical protein
VHKTGLMAATNYVFAYAGDADGSVCADMHAQAGYHDSSLDHVHTIEPASVRADAADADRGFIRHANRPCPCEQCLQGGNSACTVKRLFVNTVGKSEIEQRTGMHGSPYVDPIHGRSSARAQRRVVLPGRRYS